MSDLFTLYIVPTPLGNLEDITLRALRILREVKLIAAEDTRTTHKLLDRYQIDTPLTSYHEHNKLTKLDRIFEALAEGDVALVSDAGTPGISDPGYELIREALDRGINIVPLPGASAVITALVGSGLPTDGFKYVGFLPRKDKSLRDFLAELANERDTLIAYESPNRLRDTLRAIYEVLGDRQIVVARELTKFHEEFRRGSVSKVIAHFEVVEPRGEITLVIAGDTTTTIAEKWTEDQVLAALGEQLLKGIPRKEAAKTVASHAQWDRREVYRLSLTLE
ncbi:MAG: 16S rRNA (cytidine(1402)-2'-O)-methyltransferase [Anaerolineae bacterium]|nr:16S rRNA (cytidine(1402)-2'-O)-methyltransferase [Anaerolineae bacterium]